MAFITCRDASNLMIYEYFSINNTMEFLEQFFKIKKSKNTGHMCTFMQSYMFTIYCLNNLFDYNVQLKLTAFFHYSPTFLGQSYWKHTQNVQKFYKER